MHPSGCTPALAELEVVAVPSSSLAVPTRPGPAPDFCLIRWARFADMRDRRRGRVRWRPLVSAGQRRGRLPDWLPGHDWLLGWLLRYSASAHPAAGSCRLAGPE